jgi:hypothetical protein
MFVELNGTLLTLLSIGLLQRSMLRLRAGRRSALAPSAPSVRRPRRYAKERKFVIIGKEESELPYLPNAVIPPKSDAKWSEFKKQAVASASLNTFVGTLMTVAPVAATALPVTILALETGNFYDFINVWNAINSVVEVPSELITEFTALAESCNLPEEFIAIFSAT